MARKTALFKIWDGDKLIGLEWNNSTAADSSTPTREEEEFFRIFQEHKRLMGALKKYGRHTKLCEITTRPFQGSTNSQWECTCDYGKTVHCDFCKGKGHVMLKRIREGYYTGFCQECGLG